MAKAPIKNQIAKDMATMYGQGDSELSSVAFHAALSAIESYMHRTSEDFTA
ncbi:hypothetical protein [Brevibacterium sp. CFH 10365]|uniref:hypothetical protein n=1 Tax=Brevibacterium sp. CFH 10365 TaxID=2585207 RepID=UPI00187AE7DD|nr:hypothetical protein [Brevibacterium sp. CFH 10365]